MGRAEGRNSLKSLTRGSSTFCHVICSNMMRSKQWMWAWTEGGGRVIGAIEKKGNPVKFPIWGRGDKSNL